MVGVIDEEIRMKKLMFATALVVSAAAFADGLLNATSFEGYPVDAAVVDSGGGGVGESGAGVNYFYYEGYSDGSATVLFSRRLWITELRRRSFI